MSTGGEYDKAYIHQVDLTHLADDVPYMTDENLYGIFKALDQEIQRREGVKQEMLRQELAQIERRAREIRGLLGEDVEQEAMPVELLGSFHSKSRLGTVHHVNRYSDDTVRCTCEGYRYNRHCWHVDASI